MAMKLFGYWRSMATFRVRMAMNVKGIKPDEEVSIDLTTGAQFAEAYKKVNPQMVLPALVDGAPPVLFQSIPIMEYLEETHPKPPILPADPRGRARVRGLAQIVASEAHPLYVPRIRNYLQKELKLDDAQLAKWIHHWQGTALQAIETHLSGDRETGRFCHGDAPTMADICLVSHVVACRLFKLDLTPWPTCVRIVDECLKLDAFARAHPLKQPDAPKEITH
jgi:maleylacetoacetate isomerase